ncbi:MAG: hypothetical protein ACW98K_00200 [Candidatus Kariarchaeaceae archaeon]|jgi:hypothetical protein
MPDKVTGYYQQIHFKINELILFYNYPTITDEVSRFGECPHIKKLRCSRAHELAPDRCITERKCEVHLNREVLFIDGVGINGSELKKLDQKLREK